MFDADTESDTTSNHEKDSSSHPLILYRQPRPSLRRSTSVRMARLKRKRKFAQFLLNAAVIFIVLGVTTVLVIAFKTTTTTTEKETTTKRERTNNERESDIASRRSKKLYKILFWSNEKSWDLAIRNISPEDFNCRLDLRYDPVQPSLSSSSSSSKFLAQYNAVIITSGLNISNGFLQNIPSKQLLVYANKDQTMNGTSPIFDRINLTMTYRISSDIVWHDLEFVHLKDGSKVAPEANPQWRDFHIFNRTHRDYMSSLVKSIEKRTNFGIIRLCRNDTIDALIYDELKNYISTPEIIDVDYGCDSAPFDETLLGNYKFLLAFESQLCTDSISELFYIALKHHVVPVVLGGPIDYHNFAPPHSYILGQSFASIRELAEHLTHLEGNPLEYVEYLWWTRIYRVQRALSPLYELCRILSDDQYTFYETVSRDWWKDVQCLKTILLLGN